MNRAERFFQEPSITEIVESNPEVFNAINGGELDLNFESTIEAAAKQALASSVTSSPSAKERGEESSAEKAGGEDAESSSGEEVAFDETTSGIGGNWQAPKGESEEVHKPSKSGSWGVFDRPSDISKAYGGGKRIGVGGADADPEASAQKQAETAAALNRFRVKSGNGDPLVEKQKSAEINAALLLARESMAKGRSEEAAETLMAVTPFLSFGTLLGGTVYLEYGMALEACGGDKPGEAMNVYRRVASQNGDEVIRKQAKQLMFGFEAMKFFKVESEDLEGSKLIDKMYQGSLAQPVIPREAWSGDFLDNSYDTSFLFLTKERRSKLKLDDKYVCKDFDEARSILTRAAKFRSRNREVAFGSGKLMGAFTRLAVERGGPDSTDDPLLLSGKWRLSISSKPVGPAGNGIEFLIKTKTLRQELLDMDKLEKRNGSSYAAAAAAAEGSNGDGGDTTGAWTMQFEKVQVEDAAPLMQQQEQQQQFEDRDNSSSAVPLPSFSWSVPQMHVAVPFLNLKADCKGRIEKGAWPNPSWELVVVLTEGRLAKKGFSLPLPAAPQPALSTVLTVDEEILVAMSTAAGDTRPSFDVWIREG
mmetsp:Transcript_6195/g.11601  ORF Transcript_6195/g.11601 Transcript_6195/m.11601 type:complete len:590 (+) Transcript_6195:2-1771(+)